MFNQIVDLIKDDQKQIKEIKNILTELVNQLQIQNQTANEYQQRILNENESIKMENQQLKAQNQQLQSENQKFKSDSQDLENQNAMIINQIQTKNEKEFESMKKEIKAIQPTLEPISQLPTFQPTQSDILTTINRIYQLHQISIPYLSSSPFTGILNHFKQNRNIRIISGHPHDGSNGTVNDMIDNSDKTFYWADATAETTWVDFQLLKQKIDLSSYQIKTYIYEAGHPHPKEWKILGSNDREHWDVLDHQKNCSELNATSTTKHFVCQTPTHKPYQYIRYHQISNWHTNQNVYKYSLRISRFELYGDVYIP